MLNQSCTYKLDKLYPSDSQFIRGQVKWQSNLYFPRIEEFRQSPIGFNKIVFLGNSITQGGNNWNQRLNDFLCDDPIRDVKLHSFYNRNNDQGHDQESGLLPG